MLRLMERVLSGAPWIVAMDYYESDELIPVTAALLAAWRTFPFPFRFAFAFSRDHVKSIPDTTYVTFARVHGVVTGVKDC